jgi:competence protein ComEC
MNTHIKTIIAVVGVLLGIIVGEVSMYASEIVVGACVLVVTQMEWKRKHMSDTDGVTHVFSFPLVVILFSIGLSVGIIRTQLVEEKINFVCETTCIFDAQIISSPETKNAFQILRVHPLIDNEQLYDVQVRTSLYPKYEIGDTLKISGKVATPDVLFPHSTIKSNNRAFDYQSYLQTKNIGSEIAYPNIEVVDTNAHTFPTLVGRWKESLVSRMDSYVAQPASALASGMLFGASSMSEDLLQTFRTAGLSHIIVLSGFNIVIVISSILFILTFLPLVVRITLASLSVIVFVVMVGASPSVVRATLMAFISLLAMLTGRMYVARQALILSLFAIVMYEPYALSHDVSLHLSFLATMGLVYLSEPLELFFKKYYERITNTSLRELLITTLSAYFATLPYVMYTFGSVSVYALIANVLVVPMVPLAMLISFFVVMSSYFSETASSLLGFIDTFLINCMLWIAKIIELFPLASFKITISFGMMSFLYCCIFIFIQYILIKEKNNAKRTSLIGKNETKTTDKYGNLTDTFSY